MSGPDLHHNRLVVNDKCGDYQIVKKIGNGTFGLVYEAFHQLTRQKVALKRIMITSNKNASDNYIKSAKLEALFLKITCLAEGASQYFIECHETFYDRKRSGQFNIITTLLTGETLMDRYIKKRRSPAIKTTMILAKQFFNALIFLKKQELIHTDIKPENVVFVLPQYKKDGLTKIDTTYQIKIIDFGGATPDSPEKFNNDRTINPAKERCPRKTRTICTAEYRPPEVVLEYDWSYPVDVWSFGCILYELIARKSIFPPGLDNEESYDSIYQNKDIHFQELRDCENETCYENRVGVIPLKEELYTSWKKSLSKTTLTTPVSIL